MGMRRGRTPAFGRTARLIVGALAVAAVATTSALAGTIVGTAKNDTIRGTARADKLYGRGGNDSLFGMAGGDYLNGGPGKDRFSCGAGRDTVVAEKGEIVARDCEVVRRTGGTTPPPPPTTPAPPTPPPPAPPPPPPAPPAKAGFYGGFTSTGGGVTFVVAGDGRTFALDASGDGITVKFSGTFSEDGSTVAGRFQIHVSFDYQGTHYECDSGGADWSAKWQS